MGWTADTPPSPGQVREWQLDRLRALVAHARENSPFYARTLSGVDVASIRTAEDFSRLPTVSADDLRREPEQFLCVSQDEIERVVTLQSSGTTGHPKRIFHTADDMEATADFFDWGMRNMVGPGQAVLVLMPGDRPGGVGRLLDDALGRFGARAACHGVMEDARAAVDQFLVEDASCIVGPPAHVNLMACEWERRRLPRDMVRSVLLCWDAVPDAVAANAERIFGCRAFRHWGMIETGLGGAVECMPGSGLHLREADLYLEIVDPRTGRLVSDGEPGEMVVSTPLRRGMPLLRYRTGDAGRILPVRCRCGSPLRLLDPHVRRMADGVDIGAGRIRLEDLNEVLYALPGLGDFAARVAGGTLYVFARGRVGRERIETALMSLPVVGQGLADGVLRIAVETSNDAVPAVPGLGKRRIEIDREL
ncbi:MAG: phenylacetate--CoA ligase family protein [Desulfovibrionaceae bacterium]|nr:phenylacetate--CoA ligase family protein [Desulfovibrionaceae bacterium]